MGRVLANQVLWRLAVASFFAMFTVAYTSSAWVSEDAFITFRVIDNIWGGLGAVWNTGERVQVYTHPLWMLLLLPVGWDLNSLYWGAVAFSFILSLACLAILVARLVEPNAWSALMVLCSLLFSRSFMDYSSSGLENPLVHLLVACVALVWLGWRDRPSAPLISSFIAALLFLARPDSLLIAIPFLAEFAWRARSNPCYFLKICLLGFSPAIVWIGFSIFYYGLPVPNTALAKVGTGKDIGAAFLASVNYVKWTGIKDPGSIVIILCGLGAALSGWNKGLRPVAVAILLWLLYLCYVGADYMGGRFLSPLIVLSVIPLLQEVHRVRPGRVVFLVLAFMAAFSPALATTISLPRGFELSAISNDGIADERAVYYGALGVVPVVKTGKISHPWLISGLSLRNSPGLYTRCTVGMAGYAAGPAVHIVDKLALTEPFLARLPARDGARVGHYERAFPSGYMESLLSGENLVADPALASMYADLQLVTQGKLFSIERIAGIARLNLRYGHANFNFDRNAVDIPGMGPSSADKFACYGLEFGGRLTFRVEGPPLAFKLVPSASL